MGVKVSGLFVRSFIARACALILVLSMAACLAGPPPQPQPNEKMTLGVTGVALTALLLVGAYYVNDRFALSKKLSNQVARFTQTGNAGEVNGEEPSATEADAGAPSPGNTADLVELPDLSEPLGDPPPGESADNVSAPIDEDLFAVPPVEQGHEFPLDPATSDASFVSSPSAACSPRFLPFPGKTTAAYAQAAGAGDYVAISCDPAVDTATLPADQTCAYGDWRNAPTDTRVAAYVVPLATRGRGTWCDPTQSSDRVCAPGFVCGAHPNYQRTYEAHVLSMENAAPLGEEPTYAQIAAADGVELREVTSSTCLLEGEEQASCDCQPQIAAVQAEPALIGELTAFADALVTGTAAEPPAGPVGELLACIASVLGS